MARIEESIEINAPPEKVSPLVKWERLPDWYDPMKKVEWTSKEQNKVGSTVHVKGELAGTKVDWDAEITEVANGSAGVNAYRSISGNVTTFGSITLSSTKAGTKLTILIDYQLPHSVLGKLLDKLIFQKAFEKSFETSLKKLKATVEE